MNKQDEETLERIQSKMAFCEYWEQLADIAWSFIEKDREKRGIEGEKMTIKERIETRLLTAKKSLKESEAIKDVPHINWLKGRIATYETVLKMLAEKGNQ